MSETNVNDLFTDAVDDDVLSSQAIQALDVVDIGAQIQEGLGIDVDDVDVSEVVLVTVLVDDSGSIRFANNAQLVRDGHNLVLASLKDSKQRDGILVHNRYLNGKVLYPYKPLDLAEDMTSQNYNPGGGTPLYDQTIVVLGTVLAKAQEFVNNGVPVRTVTLIITDGEDVGSYKSAVDVKPIVEDMFKAENHIVAAMGIDDGGTDFRQVFSEMGVPAEWILTPGNNESDIRTAFQVFSQSAVRASQAANFSQVAVGGFGG